MNSNELQTKFKNLSDGLGNLRLEKAKLEANLDTLIKQKDTAFNKIKELANVSSIEEAEEKLVKLKTKLDELAKEAEELLNE